MNPTTLRRGVLCATAAFFLFPVGTALGAVTTPGPYQGWLEDARVPTPTTNIEVVVGVDEGCAGSLGCAAPDGTTIYLLFPDDRRTFLHELGHAFDFTVLTDTQRDRFTALLGPARDTLAWWSAEDGKSAGEWFADAYMQCARLPRIAARWGYSVSSGILQGWRLRRECGLIRGAA